MSVKPSQILQWALLTAVETRQGGSNKAEPTQELKNNGSLDGNLSLNHFNFMINILGLWSEFANDVFALSNGSGVGLTKDDHYSFIVAFDKTDLNKYVQGIAYKVGIAAATTKIINNATLTFGTPLANGTIPISGATGTDIVAFSLNFKLT